MSSKRPLEVPHVGLCTNDDVVSDPHVLVDGSTFEHQASSYAERRSGISLGRFSSKKLLPLIEVCAQHDHLSEFAAPAHRVAEPYHQFLDLRTGYEGAFRNEGVADL